MSVKNLFFARSSAKLPSPPLFSIIGRGKRRQDVLPAPLLPYFIPAAFYFFIKVKSELASYLLAPEHLQEEHVGGRPHHRNRRARCRRPLVDRALQKNTNIADNHGKKLPEQLSV
jgi:hypothetical protein